jgi:tRNA-uridine 2-sulfurtransferase
MPKAIALYSGGLDSVLAVLIMKRLGVEVTPVQFITGFGCSVSRRSRGKPTSPNPEIYGLTVEKRHIGEAFFELVKNPKFGHGRNMNPCVDCKALMLKEAKKIMEERGADFLITGEVLGQRPMSQRRDVFFVIEKEAGVSGLLLRPLCAKLLKPTIAEEKGLVDRDRLYGFSGRSRKPQMNLAAEFGLPEYAQPAGGCVLTDPTFSSRLRELLARNPSPAQRDIRLLRLGRHFLTADGFTIIIGRDERDNDAIEPLAGPDDYLLRLSSDCGSPLALAESAISKEGLNLAARLCVRYSASRNQSSVPVNISRNGDAYGVEVAPADDREIEQLRTHAHEQYSADRA